MRACRRVLPLAVLAALAVGPASADAQSAIGQPGDTSRIEYVQSTTTADGTRWDLFRNLAYPCSISGYQTFAIGNRTGSASDDLAPLWVRMRGGGVGFFSPGGQPQPSAGNKTEDGIGELVEFAEGNELNSLISAEPAQFRTVSVSMCSHDLYAGANTPDPNNPNLAPDGSPRMTNGLLATMAAIQFTQERYPTTATFLHGTSAGSAGTYQVAYGMEEQDRPVAGFVADSGVINQQAEIDQNNAGGECARGAATLAAISARLDPFFRDPANQPHLLVSSGRLATPVFNVWNRDDQNACGETQVPCTLPDGGVVSLGGNECRQQRIAAAIEALPPSSRSRTMRVCVRGANDPLGDCSRHVVTNVKASLYPNTDPLFPADFNAEILSWVRERLGDRPPALEVRLGRANRIAASRGRLKLRCESGGYERRHCRARVFELLPNGRTRRIGSGERSLRPGVSRHEITVKLTTAGRRALARAKGKRGIRVLTDLRVDESNTGRRGETSRRVRLIERG